VISRNDLDLWSWRWHQKHWRVY